MYVVDSERNPRLYGRPMVYGICITSGYRLSGDTSNRWSVAGDFGLAVGILRVGLSLAFLIMSSIIPTWLIDTYGGSVKSITIPR